MSENEPEIDDGGAAFPVPNDANVNGQTGMTLRAYAAIKLRMPYSGIDWLDKMIWMAKRDEFAGQALAGMMSIRHVAEEVLDSTIADSAYQHADAMLKARAQ